MYEFNGKKYRQKSDKIYHHKYHEIYPKYIERFYQKTGSMIEIGIQEGSSLEMWLNVFPNMFIYGVDINIDISGERYKVFKFDQSKSEDMDELITKLEIKPIHFIIDDGSHNPEHQLLTFNKLFPVLEKGGVYIIEDIETSYWTKNHLYGYPTIYGYKHPKSIVEIFKNIIDCVNNEFMKEPIDTPVQHLNEIKSITFAYNCIIVEKKEYIENRTYRFLGNL